MTYSVYSRSQVTFPVTCLSRTWLLHLILCCILASFLPMNVWLCLFLSISICLCHCRFVVKKSFRLSEHSSIHFDVIKIALIQFACWMECAKWITDLTLPIYRICFYWLDKWPGRVSRKAIYQWPQWPAVYFWVYFALAYQSICKSEDRTSFIAQPIKVGIGKKSIESCSYRMWAVAKSSEPVKRGLQKFTEAAQLGAWISN